MDTEELNKPNFARIFWENAVMQLMLSDPEHNIKNAIDGADEMLRGWYNRPKHGNA